MPITFTALPWHIQANLIEKLDTKEFIEFMKSSKYTRNHAKCRKTALSVPDELGDNIILNSTEGELRASHRKNDFMALVDLPTKQFTTTELLEYRFEVWNVELQTELDDTICRDLIQFFHQTGSKTKAVVCEQGSITCDPELFKIFLVVSKANLIHAGGQYTSPEHVRQIPENYDFSVKSKLNDDDFLNINSVYFTIDETEITSNGINRFLKDWRDGNKKIDTIVIQTNRRIDKDEILRGLDFTDIGPDPYSHTHDVYTVHNNGDQLRVSLIPSEGHISIAFSYQI